MNPIALQLLMWVLQKVLDAQNLENFKRAVVAFIKEKVEASPATWDDVIFNYIMGMYDEQFCIDIRKFIIDQLRGFAADTSTVVDDFLVEKAAWLLGVE